MATSVFVRGFDFGTSEEDVSQHCSQAGSVEEVDMWGRGAAVVTFPTHQEAQQAVKILNGTCIGANSRYIDVKLNDATKGKGVKAEKAPKRFHSDDKDPKRTVLVRGYDFGTTDDQLESHMAQAGTMVNVRWFTKGSCAVTYSTVEEAKYAIETLNQTTIEGNSRYIDVLLDNGPPSMSGGPPAKKARTASNDDSGAWVWVPSGSLLSLGGGGKGKGKGAVGKGSVGKGAISAIPKGSSKGTSGKGKSDPAGSGRVFVRGFDFETPDEQLLQHMKKAGPIAAVHYVTKGSANVVFKDKAAALKAIRILHGTTIPGNSRYIDVLEAER